MTDQSPSRRRGFLRLAGAATVGFSSGCLGVFGSGQLDGTVVISADPLLKDGLDTAAFHEAGVPETVTVEITAGPQETGDRATGFKNILDAKQPRPDLMMTDVGWTIPFIVRGDLLNLETNLSNSFLEDLRENTFEMLIKTATDPASGDLYAVPYFPDYPSMQYRKDLFRAAGYTDTEFNSWAQTPPSWTEWSQIVSQVLETATVEHGYVWQAAEYIGLACCTFNELLTAYGGAYFGGREFLFGPVGQRPVTVDAPEAIEAVRAGRDLVVGAGNGSPTGITAVSPEYVYDWTERDTKAQFIDNRRAVAMRNWTYTIRAASEQWESPEELGVMPLPRGPAGSQHALGGWNMAVNPHTKNRPAALEVLKAIHSEPVQMATLNGAGFLPHDPSLFSGPATDHPVYGEHMDVLARIGETTISRPVTAVWPKQRSEIATAVHSAFTGQQSPREAMGGLAERLKTIENS